MLSNSVVIFAKAFILEGAILREGDFWNYGILMGMKSEILIYQGKDGSTKVDVKLVDDTVWLTQEQMAKLFQKAKSTVNEHIRNIFEEGELQEGVVMRKFGNSEFSKCPPATTILSLNDREVLGHGGRISMEAAERHAIEEYEKYRALERQRLDAAEDDLNRAIKELRSSEKTRNRNR